MTEPREVPKKRGETTEVLPLIGLRDMVLFPHTVRPFVVGRPNSIAAVNGAMLEDRRVFLALQRDPALEEPPPSGLHRTGVTASILQALTLPNGHIKLLVEGRRRGVIQEFLLDSPTPHVAVRPVEEGSVVTPEVEGLVTQVGRIFEELSRKQPSLAHEPGSGALTPESPGAFADQVASHLQVPAEVKQKVLDVLDLADRLKLVKRLLLAELDQLNLDQRLNKEVEKQIEKAQREYYLNEKMKLIRKELGRDEGGGDLEELKAKVEKSGMPPVAKEKALQEIKRLEFMPPVSAEATVSRSYVDWLLALPWAKESRDKTDVKRAARILDEDHYGLEKVKERILEFLSVRQLAKDHKGSILCFVGPPGVGKTPVAKSIAKSMGREFVRLSLGGVHDEAEIKGHRRTYIGAFPGQIAQLMRRAGTKNPVFLLDEVDKLGSDFRGDPSSALLEVLDPEQNSNFLDHFIDLRFDLSNILFIATANQMDTIPSPLLDRMEVMKLSGYILEEKVQIATRFLLPKQVREHGLEKGDVEIDKTSLKLIINGYAREAGVRSLENNIRKIMRKITRQFAEGKTKKIKVTAKNLAEFLGNPRFTDESLYDRRIPGVIMGLAWTSMGGATLYVEATAVPSKNRGFKQTGQLGDVMKESTEIAYTYVSSRIRDYGIAGDFFEGNLIHLHVPAGATPKDGPSAGITMASALYSLAKKKPIKLHIAMTGELTITGKVLPIGGVKEKTIAAKRAGVKTLIFPFENKKDYDELPKYIVKGLKVHFVNYFDEVLKIVY